MSAWERFCDRAYFDMWCVRPVGCRKFGQGFHVVNESSARDLCDYLNSIDAPNPHKAEDVA